jgi:small subunit ribosomal protein S9
MEKKTTTKKKTTSKASKATKLKATQSVGKYFYAIGRRKSAVATVRLFEGTDSSEINGNSIIKGAKQLSSSEIFFINEPLRVASKDASMYFTAKVIGGGVSSQLAAIRLGVARALLKFDNTLKKSLKQADLIKRDPREVERKKVGLKKARKGPQFSKR